MKKPSRFMPAYIPEQMSFTVNAGIYLFLVFIISVFAVWVWKSPGFFLLFASVVTIGTLVINYKDKLRLRDLAKDRLDENICNFARSFDRNEVDPWVIRAVYEEFQPYMKLPDGVCPLRATDKISEDLNVDFDDVDMDMLPVVAQRTGRTLDDFEDNPYWGRVVTVGDLVYFFNCQPISKD